MTRVIEFLISLLIVAALFVVIGLFLPAKRTFSFSTETNRPMGTVTDLLNGFTRFKDWNPLLRHDPRMQTSLSGPAEGVGAKFNYNSRDKIIGQGSWEIVESVPGERIKYKLTNDARGSDKFMTFKLERTGQGNKNVKITQQYTVDYGWDLLGRYAGLYVTRNVGDDIKRGLDKFTTFLATVPKFDYSSHATPFAFEDLPAQDVLVVTTASKRSNDEIAQAMSSQVQWINKVMTANGLVAAGPLRIVTNEFTGDTYGFDVVQPVRKADAPADAPVGEKLNVTLESTVVYEQIPARRVATTTYVGPAPGLPRERDVLRAWAMAHGSDTQDRPFEDYIGGITTMLAEDAQFKVYWPVK
ncbi:SRPBCC family protein [Arenimonas oryziterrae]|uniref:Polyketide cyclase n=1 Tax=Arenimonas oryziterrae DSM 21050 = YC6267 TaxID=1121015 RepID=A0A091B1J1_9GAMM|nr:SRPBCC family protein [Arenimonas oryziterrae]KFN44779.1 hypothetical protein N789_01840 [Arenimonas oryziterrae DSM 21050 = YC6267]